MQRYVESLASFVIVWWNKLNDMKLLTVVIMRTAEGQESGNQITDLEDMMLTDPCVAIANFTRLKSYERFVFANTLQCLSISKSVAKLSILPFCLKKRPLRLEEVSSLKSNCFVRIALIKWNVWSRSSLFHPSVKVTFSNSEAIKATSKG